MQFVVTRAMGLSRPIESRPMAPLRTWRGAPGSRRRPLVRSGMESIHPQAQAGGHQDLAAREDPVDLVVFRPGRTRACRSSPRSAGRWTRYRRPAGRPGRSAAPGPADAGPRRSARRSYATHRPCLSPGNAGRCRPRRWPAASWPGACRESPGAGSSARCVAAGPGRWPAPPMKWVPKPSSLSLLDSCQGNRPWVASASTIWADAVSWASVRRSKGSPR